MMFYMVIMAILIGTNFSRSGCGSESKYIDIQFLYFILSHIVRYFFDAKILYKDARQFHSIIKVWRVSDGGGVRVRGQLRQQSGHRGRGGREGGRGQCLITPYLSLQYILQ